VCCVWKLCSRYEHHWTLFQRVKASGNGETELHDRPRSGHPATTTSPDMLQGANDIIHADWCMTSRQMAIQLSVINGNTTDSARQCPSSHKSLNPRGNCQIWLDCAPPSPHSPDLAPSYFHLFGPLKGTLRGTRFEDDKNVIHAVRTWLCEQEMSWYREGLHALVSR
jgi:hypothetical protein